MEESSRESQPRCPCGFWGSSKTLGLCSVCYRQAHRNQTQGNTNTSDAGRTGVGNCHSQSQNSQGKRMDSKHFSSRSTADNLPSSLSSPPGERTALSATPASSVDASTPATSGGGNTSSHLPSNVAAGGVDNQTETTTMTMPSCESLLTSDVSDLCSTASSDLSHDSKHDTGSCASDSYASLISVTSGSAAAMPSFATSESNEECINIDCQVAGSQSSIAGVGCRTDIASKSSTQSPSDCAKTVGVCADTTVVSNTVASSSKNFAKNVDTGDRHTNTSTPCEINSQAPASRNNPLTDTSRSTEPAPLEANISSAQARGTKRSRDEMESEELFPSQKNKRRCYTCSCKLELAQRTIGRCRCDRVFCALHRLPELHQCDFNHKEDGRREAREKMIKPTRHLGPSYRREDHS